MGTVSVSMPKKLEKIVEYYAKRLGVSKSEFIKQAVRYYVTHVAREKGLDRYLRVRLAH